MQLVTEPSLLGLNLFAIRIGAELFVAAPSRIRVGGQTLAAERVHPVSQLAAGGMRFDRFAIVTDPLTEVRQQVSQLVTLGFKQRLNAQPVASSTSMSVCLKRLKAPSDGTR